MMKANEIKKLIKSNFNWDIFCDLVRNYECINEKYYSDTHDKLYASTGLKVENVEVIVNKNLVQWIVSINEKPYCFNGEYDSYEGKSMDNHNFHDVKLVEKTIFVWEPV